MLSSEFFYYAGFVLAGIVIMYFILRWTFDVPMRTRHIKAQTELLSKIAIRQGMGMDEAETIVNNANNP